MTILNGTVTANIYNQNNQLVRSYTTTNTITTSGINRLIDMLIDGFDSNSPDYLGDYTKEDYTKSLLHNKYDFTGGKSGEVFGIKPVEWKSRNKSTFTASTDSTSLNMLSNPNYMFNNHPSLYTCFNSGYRGETDYYPGSSMQSGWIADLGLNTVIDEVIIASDMINYVNLSKKNLKYGTVVVKSNDKLTTYVSGTDYEFSLGDGINFGKIRILKAELLNVNLKISYQWFDVPQVPIVGLALDIGSNYNSGFASRACCFTSIHYSLNQGKTRTKSFLPFNTGTPSEFAWMRRHYSDYFYYGWFCDNKGLPSTYFLNTLPWSVTNPTQIAFFGQSLDYQKHIYELNLLTYKLPKLGFHAIGLGDGTGTVSEADINLFSSKIKKVLNTKTINGTTGITFKAYVDYNEGNDITFTEAGLFFPSNEDCYFSEDSFYNSISTEHKDNLSGNAKFYKLSSLDVNDCDTLGTHALFTIPWSKTSSERIELIYNINPVW